MSMTLKVPVRQQITLPDAWQECLTPQELSYWLIAKFEQFESGYEVTVQELKDVEKAVTKLQNDVSSLQTVSDSLKVSVQSLTMASQNLAERCTDLEMDVANLQTFRTQADTHFNQIEQTLSQIQTKIAELTSTAEQNSVNISNMAGTVAGLDKRVEALEDGSGGGATPLYEHDVTFRLSATRGATADITARLFSHVSTPWNADEDEPQTFLTTFDGLYKFTSMGSTGRRFPCNGLYYSNGEGNQPIVDITIFAIEGNLRFDVRSYEPLSTTSRDLQTNVFMFESSVSLIDDRVTKVL